MCKEPLVSAYRLSIIVKISAMRTRTAATIAMILSTVNLFFGDASSPSPPDELPWLLGSFGLLLPRSLPDPDDDPHSPDALRLVLDAWRLALGAFCSIFACIQ